MQAFLHQIASGLAAGGIYASLAIALVLIYRCTSSINFAQGELAMFSTYMSWALVQAGASWWVAFAVVVVGAFLLGLALERVIFGAFYQSGQSCIGVQRILIHADIYAPLRDLLVTKARALVAGDPRAEATFIGPMIAESEAARLEDWINEARAAGATLLCGGDRSGAMLQATLLEGVPRGQKIREEEAFGPVAILSAFTEFEAALDEVNDSRFGLQAGIFTRDIHKAMAAWDRLEVGGVLIGDVPSYRVDNMPYGGVKDSGLGREGIRWAINDMTEERLLVIRTAP